MRRAGNILLISTELIDGSTGYTRWSGEYERPINDVFAIQDEIATAVGTALLIFARHVGDRETLTLCGRSLTVEQCIGSRVARTDFTVEWLTVEPSAGQGSLLQLTGEGRSVRVGRFLRPEMRPVLARELRRALRRAPAGPAPQHTDSP